MDRDGCTKLLAGAAQAGVARFVVVSAVGGENPPTGDDVFSVYLRAKADADDAVRGSDRDWTIVRPGGLTDDPVTGSARIDTEPFRGTVSVRTSLRCWRRSRSAVAARGGLRCVVCTRERGLRSLL